MTPRRVTGYCAHKDGGIVRLKKCGHPDRLKVARTSLANEFGVTPENIKAIVTGRSWVA